ncbi:hypothetical protein [Rhodobacter maris]|uniref:hypothetical protein n=1 Tax=Rhodobacter maris TaxID=446682 RepID=UPI0011422FC0|nr:hypothetical protein [Rhodobacter maris]
MAARRGHTFPNEINFPARPTARQTPIERKGEIPQTSNGKAPQNPIQALAKDSHKRAAKLLGYGLILDTPEAWQAVASVWAARLTTGERAAILIAALHSLHPEQAEVICAHAFSGGAA